MTLTYVHDPEYVWEGWYLEDTLLGHGPDISALALAHALAAHDAQVVAVKELVVPLSKIFGHMPDSLKELQEEAGDD